MVQTLLKKKKSPRQKGADFQNRIAAWLRARDWVVHNQKSSLVNKVVMMNGELKRLWVVQHKDIFGSDLIAKLGNRTAWLQVTLSSSGRGKRLKDFQVVERKKAKEIISDRIPWGPQDEHYIVTKTEKGVVRIRLVQPAAGKYWLVGEIRRGVLIPCREEPNTPPWPGF